MRKLTNLQIQDLIDRLRKIIDDLYSLEGVFYRGLFAAEENDLKAVIRKLQRKKQLLKEGYARAFSKNEA